MNKNNNVERIMIFNIIEGEMRISKSEAIEYFEKFSKEKDAVNCYINNQEVIDSILAQIEEVVDARNDKLISNIKGIKRLKNRTFYVGNDKKFPKGCISCLCGKGLSAIRKTNKCNVKCKFCYYYGKMDTQRAIPDKMWEIGTTEFYEKDIDLLISIYDKPTGIAYAYLEPFMEIEKYYSIIKKFNDAGIYQHLYTNGILANETTLKKLADSGLNEIRFNLGASHCSDKVIENIKCAKKFIPMVGIETPMTPEFFNEFMEKKDKILKTGLDFINCAELHLNSANMVNYKNENNYICRRGYISPIWSREITFKIMKMADDEQWDIAVHDCSNYTKYARELNFSNKLNMWYGATSYACEFEEFPYELFLPILKDPNFLF